VTSSPAASRLTRRNFLKAGAIGGATLVVGFYLPENSFAEKQEAPRVNPFNAWISVGSDGHTTLTLAKSEMGQGVYTSLIMILADELEVDWKSVKVVQAATNPDLYPDQGTGGSGSVKGSYLPLRQAGAAARAMLIEAAAKTWNVDPVTCFAKNGAVIHDPRGHRLTYGELAEKASTLPVPNLKTVTLKNPDDFSLIGTSPQHLDIPSKTDGTAQFGIDVRVPNMAYAVIARCPVFEGKVKRFDASKAKAIAGVREVVEIPAVVDGSHSAGGVAVVADSSWAAMRGREALEIEWENGAGAKESTGELRAQMKAFVAKPGTKVVNTGRAAELLDAGSPIEAEYELPFLAHATMEPMNCTADVRADRAEVWAPTQGPIWIRDMVAQVSGLKKESVTVHTTLMGGGFGRRYQSDFGVEAAQVSKAIGRPVQVLWTREDDMQHDFYRPIFQHRLSALPDGKGGITAWRHRVSSTPIAPYWHKGAKPDESEIGGAALLPYSIPNFSVEYTPVASVVPRAWWRSVEQASSGFAVESFIDELASAAKIDPLEFRLRLVGRDRTLGDSDDFPLDTARWKATLQLAAQKAGWGKPAPEGHSRGIAAFYSFDTYVAHVAEVSVEPTGKVRVHKVTTAVDCGRPIDPDGIKAQMESAVVYALSAVLMGEITIAQGRTEQSNFNDYPVLRMREMPVVDVHVVTSTKRPSGTGEPGMAPLAPAVTNAIFAATRKRIRRLPIRAEDLA
jgi:isoquinoline 1-oxidoreductase beta subunit